VQAATAAEGNQWKIARIAPAFDGDHANGALHVGVGHAYDALRGRNAIEPQRARHPVDGRRGARHIDGHLARQKLIGCDTAQHHMRVGHRRQVACAIAGRAGVGACAFRADAQETALIDARNGPSARADGVNIEHRHAHRKSIHRGLGCQAELAVPQAHIGGSPTHIERERTLETTRAGRFRRADYATRGTGKNGAHRVTPRLRHGDKSAVRLQNRDAVPGAAA
jgi:hypothetical protein